MVVLRTTMLQIYKALKRMIVSEVRDLHGWPFKDWTQNEFLGKELLSGNLTYVSFLLLEAV